MPPSSPGGDEVQQRVRAGGDGCEGVDTPADHHHHQRCAGSRDGLDQFLLHAGEFQAGGVVELANGDGAQQPALPGDHHDRQFRLLRRGDGIVEAGSIVAQYRAARGVTDRHRSAQRGAQPGQGRDMGSVEGAGRVVARGVRGQRGIQETLRRIVDKLQVGRVVVVALE